MSESNTPSIFGDSQPDAAAPQVVSASEHAQTHPFFTNAGRGSGRGGGAASLKGRGKRGKGSGGAAGGASGGLGAGDSTSLIVPDTEDRPLFGPISLKELEVAHRRNVDGAESSVFTDDDDVSVKKRKKPKHKKPTKSSKRKHEKTDEDCIAAATFGGGGGASGDESDEEDDEEDYDDDDDDDDGSECEPCYNDGDRSEAVESSVAGTGSRLLPIRGETCVGCICERGVIDVIDRFVRQNAVCMTETALYKAAAIHYRNEIVLPRRKEGVKVMKWNWKDLQSHYVLHVCDPLLQRAAAVRTLGAVRAVQEQQLMRINSDGSKQLDNKGCEMLLKIVALQDKQIQALDAARMPPPPGRGGAAR